MGVNSGCNANIDCITYDKGTCFHNNAPRVMFMRPKCILNPSADPRIVKQCALQFPWPKVIYSTPPRKP